eukprot:1864453-Lingulodinium_polyedra.AAC.1
MYELYPEEVQKELCAKWTQIREQGAGSQDFEYDMTGGWVFIVRLFHEEEKPAWREEVWDKKN